MKHFLLSKILVGAAYLSTAAAVAASGSGHSSVGDVYTMDNSAAGNHLLVFGRDAAGQLSAGPAIPTGGQGTDSGLGSQGSLSLSNDGQWLLLCNAGSDQISVFSLSPQGAQWVSNADSQGQMPISITQRGNLVYVLNAGGAAGGMDNITGFVLAAGQLMPLPNSTRFLSAANSGPAQVSFTSDGSVLVVTEKNTSLIDTFVLGADGLVQSQNTFASPAAVPFGFAVGRHNTIFVSNAASSSLSSYAISAEGDVETISDAVPNNQAAACWAALSGDGRFAYTANAATGTISGYQVMPDGSLQLLTPGGLTGSTGAGSHPIDMAFSQNSRFLYALGSGNGSLNAFRVDSSGGLQAMPGLTGIPLSASGLAAR